MHAPTYPIDRDYAAAWDWAVALRDFAKAEGVALDMCDFGWDAETGDVTLDGMSARDWVLAMLDDGEEATEDALNAYLAGDPNA